MHKMLAIDRDPAICLVDVSPDVVSRIECHASILHTFGAAHICLLECLLD